MRDRLFSWRTLAWTGALVLFGLGLWTLRAPMLRSVGGFLVSEDAVQPVDAVYTLGGASLERGQETARIINTGSAPHVWFTGANVPSALEALGICEPEAQVSLDAAVRAGMPVDKGDTLLVGTSTMEEALAIVAHARQHHFTRIMVLSSRFHLRRVRYVFGPRCREAGIALALHGAPSLTFDESQWWRSEDGLLMVNNEYVKLLYYWWHY
ncbi:MAG: YdcF family protein [Flavobacteriales bacterium]|nr:YdcF family protein [Flavobacteriales bacterium]